MQTKKISDYTDRELIERAAQNSKSACDSATWVKRFIIGVAVVQFLIWVVSQFEL